MMTLTKAIPFPLQRRQAIAGARKRINLTREVLDASSCEDDDDDDDNDDESTDSNDAVNARLHIHQELANKFLPKNYNSGKR